jgi:transcription elongation factor
MKKDQQAEQRRKCRQAAAGLAQGAKVSPWAVLPVASAAPRPSAGLPGHRYPVKKGCLGDRQAVGPIGRADK